MEAGLLFLPAPSHDGEVWQSIEGGRNAAEPPFCGLTWQKASTPAAAA
jgi:hypothetical protein